MIDLKIKLIEGGILPKKSTEHAAGFDVYARKIEWNPIHGYEEIFLGFATEIPIGYRAILIPRSSLTKYSWCMPQGQGLIDSDYRDEWVLRLKPLPGVYNKVVITNEIDTDDREVMPRMLKTFYNDTSLIPYTIGDRVGQFYIEKEIETNIIVVDELSKTKRKGGFGSTGK